MSEIQIHFLAQGQVQGVFFRANTRNKAQELGLTGWVKNLAIGDVEGIAEGKEEQIKKLINYLKNSPGNSLVTNLQIKQLKATNKYTEFKITY